MAISNSRYFTVVNVAAKIKPSPHLNTSPQRVTILKLAIRAFKDTDMANLHDLFCTSTYIGFQMSVYSFENRKTILIRVLSFHFAYGKMKTARFI